MSSGDIKHETRVVLNNVKRILEGCGASMADVVKCSVFLRDGKDFAAMNEVYAKYMAPEGAIAPARSTVEVSGLPKGALVEIDVICKESGDA